MAPPGHAGLVRLGKKRGVVLARSLLQRRFLQNLILKWQTRPLENTIIRFCLGSLCDASDVTTSAWRFLQKNTWSLGCSARARGVQGQSQECGQSLNVLWVSRDDCGCSTRTLTYFPEATVSRILKGNNRLVVLFVAGPVSSLCY